MFLKKFKIRNFRAIEDLELDFKKGLNIIVGENNSGKTAVIDALRLSFNDFQQRKDIYWSISDFRIDRSELSDIVNDIRFDLIFECEKEIESAWFNDLHAIDEEGNSNLQLHFRYHLDSKSGKIKRSVWGGEMEGGSVSYEVSSALRNVYLSPTRNTNRDLKPVRGNILGKLYNNIGDDDERDEILNEMIKLFKTNEKWKNFVKKGHDTISKHLEHLTYLAEEKSQDVEISFAPYDFDKLVQNLIFQIPVYRELPEGYDPKYFDISQNGLGYNNLIYTATVLGDIKQRNKTIEEEFTLLLIEEPEAHLHPQLQNTFFNYLNRLHDEDSFQVIVTSHSPTIAAKTNLKLLTVLQNSHNNICATQIDKLDLDNDNVDFLQKFLDVTKSQLFFANGVILVEGISEALLVPIFSKIMGEKYDLERNGIEVVNINGVAFKHFAKLFNSEDEKNRLNCRCAIITDDDDGKGVDERVDEIRKLESGNLIVIDGHKTFEYQLFRVNNKNELLLNSFADIHSRLSDELDLIDDKEARAVFFMEKIAKNNSKSKLAYKLAIELDKKLKSDKNFKDFEVPPYIKEAIICVVDGLDERYLIKDFFNIKDFCGML